MKSALDFALLDDLALAREKRGAAVLSHLGQVGINRLGPLVELCMLDRMRPNEPAAMDVLPSAPTLTLLKQAVPDRRDPAGRYGGDLLGKFGAIGTDRNPLAEDTVEWVQFCRKAQEAAELTGLPKIIAQGLVGAIRELEDTQEVDPTRTAEHVHHVTHLLAAAASKANRSSRTTKSKNFKISFLKWPKSSWSSLRFLRFIFGSFVGADLNVDFKACFRARPSDLPTACWRWPRHASIRLRERICSWLTTGTRPEACLDGEDICRGSPHRGTP